jgi:hypothetical protein
MVRVIKNNNAMIFLPLERIAEIGFKIIGYGGY